jgi:ATP-dependent Lhr-like helicase
MKNIAELYRERFPSPTLVQKEAIPLILSGKNTVVIAPTGSGKTEAALLPVLEKIHGERGIAALYITPLRALNRDISKRVEWWCERAGITHAVRHGDTSQFERGKQSRNPPQLMILTPETLQAVLVGKVLRTHLANVKYVIVDELHELVDSKRGAQLSLALERLGLIANFQRIGISATISNEEEAGKILCGVGREFSIASAGKKREMDISILKVPGSGEKAFEKIAGMLGGKQRILFVNTRSTAESLATYLNLKAEDAENIDVHHGSLAAALRINTEKEFKEGKIHTLVATSSLELGMDIGGIDEIIQFGSPRQVARMVQRVGRSGHGVERLPRGVILAPDLDDYFESLAILKKFDEGYLEERKAVRGAMDVIAHQVVGLLMDCGRMERKKIYEILSKAYSFGISFEEFERVLLQLEKERIIFVNGEEISFGKHGREYYFYNLTTIPKERKFALRDRITNRIIASLDEVFVATLTPGDSFSSKGKVWNVVEIGEELIAEPASSADFIVPDWVGEEIPVEWEVAQEAARIRKKEIKDASAENEIRIEINGEIAVMHAPFGNKVNDLLARVFTMRLSEKLRFEVRAVADPYRILFKFSYPIREEWFEGIFQIHDVKLEAEQALEGSSLLRANFLHVGRLFGMFGEDAEISDRFVRFMRGTPVYEETLNTIFRKRMSVEGAKRVVDGVRSGKLRVNIEKREKLSDIALLGIARMKGGGIAGEFEPRESILKMFREEIERKHVGLKCLNCGASRKTILKSVDVEKLKCHKCGRGALTLVSAKATPEEEKYMAGIIRSYGRRGLVALLVYGVGAKTADRVLRKLHRDEDAFYLDLIEEQKKFIKNKKYWSIRN